MSGAALDRPDRGGGLAESSDRQRDQPDHEQPGEEPSGAAQGKGPERATRQDGGLQPAGVAPEEEGARPDGQRRDHREVAREAMWRQEVGHHDPRGRPASGDGRRHEGQEHHRAADP